MLVAVELPCKIAFKLSKVTENKRRIITANVSQKRWHCRCSGKANADYLTYRLVRHAHIHNRQTTTSTNARMRAKPRPIESTKHTHTQTTQNKNNNRLDGFTLASSILIQCKCFWVSSFWIKGFLYLKHCAWSLFEKTFFSQMIGFINRISNVIHKLSKEKPNIRSNDRRPRSWSTEFYQYFFFRTISLFVYCCKSIKRLLTFWNDFSYNCYKDRFFVIIFLKRLIW